MPLKRSVKVTRSLQNKPSLDSEIHTFFIAGIKFKLKIKLFLLKSFNFYEIRFGISVFIIFAEGTEEAAGDTEMLMCEMEDEQQKQNGEVLEVMGNLDPETGMYSIQESVEETDENVEHIEEQEQTGSYVIELDNVHNSELDMPTLSLN